VHIRRIIQRDIVDAVLDVIERSATHRVVFVTGEAGIGKSTLLDDVRQELMTDDREIVIARAECSTPVAGQDVGEVESLKPFADIMADLVNVTTSSAVQKRAGFKFDVSKFLVDTAPSWIGLIPVIGSPMSHALNIISSGYDQYYLHGKVRSEASKVAASQEQVFRQYVNFLRGIAQNTPVVLMIDDFHWADTSSTNLLFNLARDLQDVRVAFVVAYREDDARDARSNEGHPIVRIRHELERYDLSKAINVPKVELSEIHTLLTDRFAEYRSNAQLESWLDHHCGGNLLFVTQFLTSLVDNGFLDAQ
jgi:predicted ATPase